MLGRIIRPRRPNLLDNLLIYINKKETLSPRLFPITVIFVCRSFTRPEPIGQWKQSAVLIYRKDAY